MLVALMQPLHVPKSAKVPVPLLTPSLPTKETVLDV